MISHDEAYELLPWFVNGSLPDAERTRVLAHLDSCLSCRRVVQRERQLLAHMSAEPAADSAIDAGFRRLMGRIDSQTLGRTYRIEPRTYRSMIPEHRSAANTWAYAALMIAAMAVAIWMATPRNATEPTATFTTVTDPQANPNLIDVVFTADISLEERTSIVRGIGARIVAGPSDAGRYTLELIAGDTAAQAIEQALERLRNDERVQFAGLSYTAPTDNARGNP
jgi:hypothetical protein